MKKLSGFSLMEMMIVLLIVSIVAAASAPMINKKLVGVASDKSPWVWVGQDRDIAYNLLANPQQTASIGRTAAPDDAGSPRLYIDTQNDGTIPQIAFGQNGNNVMKLRSYNRSVVFSSTDELRNVVDNSVALGWDATPEVNSVVVGSNASAGDADSVVVGQNAVGDLNSVAIGSDSNVTASNGVAVGFNTSVAQDATAIGTGARAVGQNCIAIGSGVITDASNSIAMGFSANTLGTFSLAIGTQTQASNNAIAIGHNSITGPEDVVIGLNTRGTSPDANYAQGGSVIIGKNATSTGGSAVVIGSGAQATGGSSIAIGSRGYYPNVDGGSGDGAGYGGHSGTHATHALGNTTIAIGDGPVARGNRSIAIGAGAYSQGANSIAYGNIAETGAGAENSVAIGYNANANHKDSVAIGQGATTKAPNQIVLGTNADTVYIPGKLIVKDNAYLGLNGKIYGRFFGFGNYKSGSIDRTTGGHLYFEPASLPNPESDRRLKNVGKEFVSGLEEIKKLSLFHYTYKRDKQKTPHVGVMAQDLQKIFPDAVVKGEDGFLRIRMEDMFYALVNAVKELDAKITGNSKKIETLTKENKELKEKVSKLEERLEKLEKKIK